MKRFVKILGRVVIVTAILLIIILSYIRFKRTLDPFIYKTDSNKSVFKPLSKHKELMLELNDHTKIHAALFMPDSSAVKATIFHHLGNGMDLNTAQLMYKSLLQDGFQIFAYERRGFGGSTGEDINTMQLKADALAIFDQFKKMDEVKETDIIIWGVSLGGIFATTNAAERSGDIKGLVLEGTFSSFPDVAKHYASEIKLENFKWLIPLLLHNDFPTNQEIKKSTPVVGTIFHYPGKGMNLMSSVQDSYKPLFKKGFQVFCFERRDFGKSNGEADNSLTLKKDALLVFDKVAQFDDVSKKPIIIWGQSLGGAFATMNVKERQDKIKGLLLEGTFNSFPAIGKVYAKALSLENFKWIVPLLMNNDFAAEDEIKELTIPTIIIHSKLDEQVPYELGQKLFESANKENTKFWKINGKHISGIYDNEEQYVDEFINMTQK